MNVSETRWASCLQTWTSAKLAGPRARKHGHQRNALGLVRGNMDVSETRWASCAPKTSLKRSFCQFSLTNATAIVYWMPVLTNMNPAELQGCLCVKTWRPQSCRDAHVRKHGGRGVAGMPVLASMEAAELQGCPCVETWRPLQFFELHARPKQASNDHFVNFH